MGPWIDPPDTDPPGQTDAQAIRDVVRVVRALGKYYFRFEARGFEHVPQGPTLVVANHSGGKIPIDTFLFAASWCDHYDFQRPLYALAHEVLTRYVPVIRDSLRRLGAVKASWDNARLLLGSGNALLVLPGGDYETYRPYQDRNRIDFGGRTGFVRIALETGVPITPVVCIGGHELFVIVRRGQRIARWLGLDKLLRFNAFPIILGFPGLLYFGPVPSPWPMPARIVARVLEPITLNRKEADHPRFRPADALNPVRVREAYDVVIARMQRGMDELAAERRYPIIG